MWEWIPVRAPWRVRPPARRHSPRSCAADPPAPQPSAAPPLNHLHSHNHAFGQVFSRMKWRRRGRKKWPTRRKRALVKEREGCGWVRTLLLLLCFLLRRRVPSLHQPQKMLSVKKSKREADEIEMLSFESSSSLFCGQKKVWRYGMAALGGYRACASRSLPPAATSAPGRNSSSASFSTAVGSLESNA